MTSILHAVAAFLLALVGYSGGAVLAAAARRTRPDPGGPARTGAGTPAAAPDGRAGDGGDDLPAHRRFLLRLGEYQGRITMGFLYFGLLAPFAAVSRLGEDPFRLGEDRTSYWRDRPLGRTGDREPSLRRQS